MPYFLLTILILLTPFVINPLGEHFFEPPKVIFVEVLIELIFLTFLFSKKLSWKTFDKQFSFLLLSLAILTISNLIFSLSAITFFGNEIRLQGIFLLWHLLILAFLSSKLNISHIPMILFPICLLFLLFTSLIVEPDINGRAIGTLGEANALAASAVFFWPLIFFINLQNKLKNNMFRIGISSVAIIIIFLSGSRSGLVAFLIQGIFLILIKFISLKKAVIFSILLILFSLVLPLIQGGGWFENRAEIWNTAIFAGSQNIFGHGFGNIEQVLTNASGILQNNIRFQSVDSSHNFLLDFWVQGGIIGVSVTLLLMILSIKGLIKRNQTIEITAFLGIICVMLFNPTSVATLVAFWFLLGQGFKSNLE